MNEFLLFFRLLYRNKWKIILIPLGTLIVCYFLVKELPSDYTSHGSLATGLVDKTEEIISIGEEDQESEINRKFENLIQMLRQKRILSQVSYALLIHELEAKPVDQFRVPVEGIKKMNAAEKAKYIRLLKQKLSRREDLLPGNPENNFLIAVLKEMSFDPQSLSGVYTIFRQGNSDYISIDATAHTPQESEFLVNSLIEHFVGFVSNRLVDNNEKAMEFLANFLEGKRSALTERMNVLREFKIRNRVLNLNEQARSLYGQIAEYEAKREIAGKEILAYSEEIRKIDKKFDPKERRYLEKSISNVNQQIVSSKERLRALNQAYVASNFSPTIKQQLDSTQHILNEQIAQVSDQYLYDPLILKDKLVTQKLTAELALDLAGNSIQSINKELQRLNKKFDELVPNEAQIQELETGITIATSEYMEALQRYNDVALASSFPVRLKPAEQAMPGNLKPSKKIIILALSGIVSFSFCIFFFFIVWYFDKSIRYPLQLASQTQVPVLGYLNYIPSPAELLKLDQSTSSKAMNQYQKLMRSIRYEVDESKVDPKVVVVTSLGEGEGKSTLSTGLSWAYNKINKRVLLIDGNLTNPSITAEHGPSVFLENIKEQLPAALTMPSEMQHVSTVGNLGGDISLQELLTRDERSLLMDFAKTHFDVILIDSESLEARNKAKEWIDHADVVLAVYAAGKTLDQDDLTRIEYLKRLEGKFAGWVLTGTRDITEKNIAST
ncbi:Mrp family chromosome partitioning ATPase [Dyadobacter jejuensis]|uniref:Mrp family chromosome partitioning ATPase n=1 Tax=Dyadobacter jejuensis TaxID=1082580 RepID=A0A316ALV9_9BACT|nr:lipopolysaccharide biosynthesis protein [Dyadobacter jejuensis]PWJ58775.1 Mrp family chromosome partitioning ATPase [Dyadobacter jejuensis]